MDNIPSDVLRTLLAVEETGTYTAAARRIGRTQAAVSLQMTKLEETAGTRLFVKTGRRIGFTLAAEKLIHHARRILDEYDHMRSAFSISPPAAHIKLGAPDDYSQVVLPTILGRISESHPHLRIELVCTTSEDLRARISARAIDIALFTTEHEEALGRIVARGRLMWVSQPAYANLAREGRLPLALFPHGCRFRRYALEALDRANRPYGVDYTSATASGIIAAVRAGLAVTVLPDQDFGEHLFRSSGDELGLPELPDYFLSIWHNPMHSNSALFASVERHIRETLQRHAWPLGCREMRAVRTRSG